MIPQFNKQNQVPIHINKSGSINKYEKLRAIILPHLSLITQATLSKYIEHFLNPMNPTNLPFEHKIALITGSGRGIGRTIALHLARNGVNVVINFFRNRQPAEETAAEIEALGRRALVVKANIGEIEQIERLFAETERVFGGLDFLIHNAASGFNRPVMEQRPKGWDWSMNINARSLLFMAQRAAIMMEPRGGGAIVSVSSPGSSRVLPDYVSVGASKAALEAITRYLAIELAPKNIVVNAVSPGIVITEALQHFAAIRDDLDIFERARALTPAGRLLTPEDIAGVVAFLCTPAASMICGQVIVVDGGYTLPVPGII
jgi:enoyl-[acyl-carrier protein] reductase III